MCPSARHSMAAPVVYQQYSSRDVAEPTSAARVPVDKKATSGLVIALALYVAFTLLFVCHSRKKD